MPNEIPRIDDKRGLLFTINRASNPLYQVESRTWADSAHRWEEADIPQAIRDKVAELKQNGKPGAFVQVLPGEAGVYLICEGNIKNVPDAADTDLQLSPPSGGRALEAYDIVICAKGGAVETDHGTVETHDGDYYVIPCARWAQVALEQADRPAFVETTKEFLLLLDDLHNRNFLSMAPDKVGEVRPSEMDPPSPAIVAINCYVLNLASFVR